MSTPSSEQQSKQQLQFQELLLERTKALAAAAAQQQQQQQQQTEKTNSIDGKFFFRFRSCSTFHLDKISTAHILNHDYIKLL